jgi:hypothetical protein
MVLPVSAFRSLAFSQKDNYLFPHETVRKELYNLRLSGFSFIRAIRRAAERTEPDLHLIKQVEQVKNVDFGKTRPAL